jgi:hypothetical protein
MHKRWASTADPKVAAFRPMAHYMHPQDLRTSLCGARILGLPTSEPFEICTACQVLGKAERRTPLPT